MHNGNDLFSIADHGVIDEFLVTLTGADNHWMFISSRGALTAGRQDAEHALFPYGTVDKVFSSRGDTGPRTFIRDKTNGAIWEPFADWTAFQYRITRKVAKNMEGTKILFEETNRDLSLSFSYSWEFSGRYGFVRTAILKNLSGTERRFEILDGVLNILCPGISNHLQTELSCLTDAYKDNAIETPTGMAIFSLASLVTDKAAPAEALGASVAWFKTRASAELSLDRKAIDDFTAGKPFITVHRTCGKRGDLLAHMDIVLAPAGVESWIFCADRDLDAAQVRKLSKEIAEMKSVKTIIDDVEQNRLRLKSLIASCDGLCASSLQMHEWHHFANTLFNSLRGGIPLDGYTVQREDLFEYIKTRNPKAASEADRLVPLNGLSIQTIRVIARETDNSDLARLLEEYLPLGFSRRHGDPSRPWNRFSINIRDPRGNPVCAFQGNWRDIFQNWEALSASWPGYLPGFIAAFLDATTLDGYNPYRIGRDGIDWETPDPENPWANIGYWNDHQIIYIQKLFERMNDFFPGTLENKLGEKKYSYACVPYRIANFDGTCRHPRATIGFDRELDKEISSRIGIEGTDARLVHGTDGNVYAATLAEKLLTLALPKIANIVPGGGIWINTQRPEWNDANNALVGNGLSIVTLAYLRRFLSFWVSLLAPLKGSTFSVAKEVAKYAREVHSALEGHETEKAASDPEARFAFMKATGLATDHYRASIYQGMRFAQGETEFSGDEIGELFQTALATIDKTLDTQKRNDGFYHAYNLLSLEDLDGSPRAEVRNLQLMLEGQVAILSSGYLDNEEATQLLEKLPSSKLYRADRNSYMLYPAKTLPDFFSKNTFTADRAQRIPFLAELLAAGDTTIITSSGDGNAHFGLTMENADAVSATLDRYEQKPEYRQLVREFRTSILELYEETFHHESFTGRSGTMYAYEGLGSIYWHMVSKLLLASGDLFTACRDADGKSTARTKRIERAYLSVRDGLGYRQSSNNYGAFPWDPYSHTPAGAFARQPGMTGQVKEEILTRQIEYGVEVRRGTITFTEAPFMAGEVEPTDSESRQWIPFDKDGKRKIEIHAGEFGFLFCGIPVVRSINKGSLISIAYETHTESITGAQIGTELSKKIFFRTAGIQYIRIE